MQVLTPPPPSLSLLKFVKKLRYRYYTRAGSVSHL